jgi:hypothetical protein
MGAFRIWRSTDFLLCGGVIGETNLTDSSLLGRVLWTQCLFEFFSRISRCCIQLPLLFFHSAGETIVSQSQTRHEQTWKKKGVTKDKDERDDTAKHYKHMT